MNRPFYSFLVAFIFFLFPCSFLFSYEIGDEVQDFYLKQTIQGANSYFDQQMNSVEYVVNGLNPGFIRKSLITVRDEEKNINTVSFYKWRPGPPEETRRLLDFYLDAKGLGFFMIQLPGVIGFTRDGRFLRDYQGRIVTMSGNYPVLGEDGPIVIPQTQDITVSRAGMIYANGNAVQRFRIAVFSSTDSLNKLFSPNGVFFISNEALPFKDNDPSIAVVQGFLESASILRAYDSKWAKPAYEAAVNTAHQITKTYRSGSSIALP